MCLYFNVILFCVNFIHIQERLKFVPLNVDISVPVCVDNGTAWTMACNVECAEFVVKKICINSAFIY